MNMNILCCSVVSVQDRFSQFGSISSSSSNLDENLHYPQQQQCAVRRLLPVHFRSWSSKRPACCPQDLHSIAHMGFWQRQNDTVVGASPPHSLEQLHFLVAVLGLLALVLLKWPVHCAEMPALSR